MRIRLSKEQIKSEFVKKVEEISGQKLLSCNQCGKCSAGCPLSFAMDLLPNQVIRLVQLGLEKEVLASRTIWYCASCLTCISRCPRGVDLPRVMEALRAMVLRKGTNYVEIPLLSKDLLEDAPQQAFMSGFRKFTAY